MDVKIHLRNDHFPWTMLGDGDLMCWVKGDIFYNDEILQENETLSLLSRLKHSYDLNKEEFTDLLRGINGSFAFVVKTSTTLLCVVDRIRSIPIFYGKTTAGIIISDDANYLKDQINPMFDEQNGAEFLLTGYVTGPATLFEGIHQIQAGECLAYAIMDNHLITHYYHQFWHGNYFSDSEKELLDRLNTVFVRAYERLVASLKEHNLTPVVPLSGGLDSRIIVAMLKRCGVDNVICFSYGRRNGREARISKQVAESLGYQWVFVGYSKRHCIGFQSKEMKDFRKYSANLASSPHIQDFFAVKKLHEDRLIPENAVFIPGHSGVIPGKPLPPVSTHPKEFSKETFVQYVLNKHYFLWHWDHDTRLYQILKEKIESTVGDVPIIDSESWANAIELFSLKERVAKFIINSVRVYEYFGYSWRMPLCDADVIDFFERVPLKYRENGNLYEKYAAERLFVNAFRDLRRIDCTTPISDKLRIISAKNKIMHIIWSRVNFFNTGSFDPKAAIFWAITGDNPGIFEIKNKCFGYNPESHFDSELMNEIMVHSSKTGFIPIVNSLGAHAFLNEVIEEGNTSE